jgi:hypothetical protein
MKNIFLLTEEELLIENLSNIINEDDAIDMVSNSSNFKKYKNEIKEWITKLKEAKEENNKNDLTKTKAAKTILLVWGGITFLGTLVTYLDFSKRLPQPVADKLFPLLGLSMLINAIATIILMVKQYPYDLKKMFIENDKERCSKKLKEIKSKTTNKKLIAEIDKLLSELESI